MAIGVGLSVIRAAAARHHFQTLDFLAHSFVEDGVSQKHQSVRAGVGVVVLNSFSWTKYARLFGVHRGSSLWAGLRGVSPPAGPFPYPTLISYLFLFLFATYYVSFLFLFSVE